MSTNKPTLLFIHSLGRTVLTDGLTIQTKFFTDTAMDVRYTAVADLKQDRTDTPLASYYDDLLTLKRTVRSSGALYAIIPGEAAPAILYSETGPKTGDVETLRLFQGRPTDGFNYPEDKTVRLPFGSLGDEIYSNPWAYRWVMSYYVLGVNNDDTLVNTKLVDPFITAFLAAGKSPEDADTYGRVWAAMSKIYTTASIAANYPSRLSSAIKAAQSEPFDADTAELETGERMTLEQWKTRCHQDVVSRYVEEFQTRHQSMIATLNGYASAIASTIIYNAIPNDQKPNMLPAPSGTHVAQVALTDEAAFEVLRAYVAKDANDRKDGEIGQIISSLHGFGLDFTAFLNGDTTCPDVYVTPVAASPNR